MQTPNLQEIDTIIGHVRGPKGDPGETPEITVTDITGGHRLTITVGEEEPITIDIMDGDKGDKGDKGDTGDDGVSPAVTVTNITGGHRVTITDADHPQGQTFDVMDGEVTQEEFDDLKIAINDPVTGLSTKAPVIIDTASGAIAHFEDGADNMPLKGLTVNIEPVQDLHGYDHPWPAGGGKNKLDISGMSTTGQNGVTFAKSSDGIVTVGGKANATVYRKVASIQTVNGVQYTITGTPSGGAVSKYRMTVGGYGYDYGSGYTFTGDGASHDISIDICTGYPESGTLTFTPMIRLATEADSTFAPYENICPISGWTGCNISRSGADTSDPTVIPISWQAEAGTVYGGTLDVTNGTLTVEWALTTPTVERINTYDNVDYANLAKPVDSKNYGNYLVHGAKSNMYQIAQVPTDGWNSASGIGKLFTKATISMFWIGFPHGTTLAEMQTALSGLQILYELATPVTYQLTQQEVTTLLGMNNIWADCGPVSVDYPADTKLYTQKINAPTDDDMTADTQIASGKYFLIGNTLYLSTTTIPAGDTIIPGTNCTKTNLAEALNALNT